MHSRGEPGEGRLLALIIATSTYTDPTLTQLRAPGRDASDLAEVLSDSAIGWFEIQTVLDEPVHTIRCRVDEFCADAERHDLLLVYLSCHGVLDEQGNLHYAATDTSRRLLAATSLEASWLNAQLEKCRCRRQVLVLDCCHSGAFARGAKGASDLALSEHFPEARGRVVLTASRATEYAFDGDQILGGGASSIFTGALVDGLRSGDADRDGDGLITVTELFDFAEDTVRAREPRQRPGLWVVGGEGKIVVARNPRGPRIEPKVLPADLEAAIASGRRLVRAGAVADLASILDGDDPGLAMTARDRLQVIADEDIPNVAQGARDALELHMVVAAPEPEAGPTPPPPPLSFWQRNTAGARSRRRLALVIVVIVAAAAAAVFAIADSGGTSTPANAAAPVKVGALYALLGLDGSANQEVLDGVKLARDYINDGDQSISGLPLEAGGGLPGLGGAKLSLVEPRRPLGRCSTRATSSPRNVLDQFVRDDHVAAVLGAYDSTITLRAIFAADQLKVPLVNAGSTVTSFTRRSGQPRFITGCKVGNRPPPLVRNRRPSPWFFRVGPNDEQAARQFFASINKSNSTSNTKVGKIAILRENRDIFGNGAAADTKQIATKAGITFPRDDFTYPSVLGARHRCDVQKAIDSAVAGVHRYDPDVVFVVSYPRMPSRSSARCNWLTKAVYRA